MPAVSFLSIRSRHAALAACVVLLVACASPLAPPAARPVADLSRQVLGARDGWAAAGSGTTGGAKAAAAQVFDVRNRAELVAALGAARVAPAASLPRIVRVHGRIDLSVDDANRAIGFDAYRDPGFSWDAYSRAYDPAAWAKKPPAGPLEAARERSAQNQAARVVLRVPSHTSLVGMGTDAKIVNGMLLLDKVENIIIRNIHFADAFDHFPGWDPKDNAGGEWNSEYDNISLRGARHVWVDHCTFSDGERTDDTARTAFGRPMQHHDGLLDITLQSSFVTVSYNHFKMHEKTNLVGSSDNETADEGQLKVSFHHNLWENTKERAPRVRFGQVHVYNNLYVARQTQPYAHGYSIGVGFRSSIVSQHNVWETPAEITAPRLTKLWKGSAFSDRGSLLNGRPVDLLAGLREANPGATLSDAPGWAPTLHGEIDPAAEVARNVRASAGSGRIPMASAGQ
jgi:pectate lyase